MWWGDVVKLKKPQVHKELFSILQRETLLFLTKKKKILSRVGGIPKPDA